MISRRGTPVLRCETVTMLGITFVVDSILTTPSRLLTILCILSKSEADRGPVHSCREILEVLICTVVTFCACPSLAGIRMTLLGVILLECNPPYPSSSMESSPPRILIESTLCWSSPSSFSNFLCYSCALISVIPVSSQPNPTIKTVSQIIFGVTTY